ncbi:GyrI-like domain-containing protein [Paenibacillus koleovorans]|uniref:GyrI-like domain-containing protein n=1 Tax=Paenibacillus koleovorans TaxID=121608 RepID=UPI000FD7EFDF|nr:GyrI-like domain-containing protein [Paenibacillus koleovorans]
MNVQLTVLDALILVGITTEAIDSSGRDSANLVKAFMKRIGEIPGRKNDKVYVYSMFSDDYMPGRTFTLFVGVESEEQVRLPEGMSSTKVAAHQYAVISHNGSVRTTGPTVDFFLKQWLPNSDYVEASPFYFQLLRSMVDDSSLVIDVWFPVVLRKEKKVTEHNIVPSLKYDGGFIHVLWDYHEAATEWYSKHFLWKSGDTHASSSEKLTRHAFGTWIKSVLSESGPHPDLVDRGVDPNVRWCWNTKDIVGAHNYFKENEIRISDIYLGPGERYYFDLWATFEGTRLTVCGYPELEQDYGARLCPSWVRIGVRDVKAAKEWYRKHVGMSLLEEHSEKGWVLMGLGVEHHPGTSLWWLETLPPNAYTGPINGPVTPCCVLHDKWVFQNYHQFLLESGVSVSDISGNLNGFARFHFFDPDGNRFSIQKY